MTLTQDQQKQLLQQIIDEIQRRQFIEHLGGLQVNDADGNMDFDKTLVVLNDLIQPDGTIQLPVQKPLPPVSVSPASVA